jgi:DNA-binding CsgD family transcriptional regulator
MKSFALYFIEKQLESVPSNAILSESTDLDELYTKGVLKGGKKALKELLEKLKKKYIKSFYEKFPKTQYEDIEEAFHDATQKIIKEKSKSNKAIEKIFKKTMTQSLAEISKNKKCIKKNLSCIKVVKSTTNQPISVLMRRAEKFLTAQEKKVIEMCAEGNTVRNIGEKLGISAATAWRSLNSGLDKIRLSHGMKSRKLG